MIEQLSAIRTWLISLQETRLGEEIAISFYAFPIIESFHVLALALVFGSIFVVDLRLVGLAWTARPVSSVLRHILPCTVSSFVLAVITGTLLFISSSERYISNPPFITKMVLLMMAGINIAIFHGVIERSIDKWSDLTKPPLAVRVSGWSSIVLWTGVIFAGRWIGFVF